MFYGIIASIPVHYPRSCTLLTLIHASPLGDLPYVLDRSKSQVFINTTGLKRPVAKKLMDAARKSSSIRKVSRTKDQIGLTLKGSDSAGALSFMACVSSSLSQMNQALERQHHKRKHLACSSHDKRQRRMNGYNNLSRR